MVTTKVQLAEAYRNCTQASSVNWLTSEQMRKSSMLRAAFLPGSLQRFDIGEGKVEEFFAAAFASRQVRLGEGS